MPTASDNAGLTVRLLVREPRYLDRDGRARSGRPLALLAYLLLGHKAPSRDELMELLWAPKPGQDLHPRLRTLLHQVRKDVGPDAIRIEGRDVLIKQSAVRCDAVEFLAHLDGGRLNAAMGLWEAPLLMGGGPADAPVFEDWATAMRAEIGRTYRKALLHEAESAGTVDPARYTLIADALVRLAPEDPAANEHVLRAALAKGDSAAISEALRQLRVVLGATGGAIPGRTAELLAVAEAASRPVSVSSSVAFDPPYTGRVAELDRSRSLISHTHQAGRGGLIGVAGQSGVGKTRFLAEIERLAHIEGMRVLRGRAYEVDSRTPYAVLVDALRPLFNEIPMRLVPAGTLETISSIMPELLPAAGHGDPHPPAEPVQIHAAVASLLERVALDRPLVLLVDDVHWADEQSRACLHRIALRAAGTPIVLAMAFRDAHERLVAPLFAAANVEMCRLQPLSPTEVDELLAGIAAFPDAAQRELLVRTMLASSGGSRLQLIQHLSHLHEVGLLTVSDQMWQLQGPLLNTAPGTAAEPVVALITRRLEALSDTERKVLAACAVLERYAAPREIAAVAGLQDQRIADQLDVLLRQRLVAAEGPMIGVAHAEIGNAALRMIHEHRRQEMFEEALRNAESNVPLPRAGVSSLARLRLACGAGDRQRAHLALLEVLGDAIRSHPDQLSAVADTVLLSAREWCPSPDFFAQLHKESSRATAEPGRIGHHVRSIRRRLSAQGAFLRADRLVPAGALALAAVLFLSRPGGTDGSGTRPFGGSGLLVLSDSSGAVHAVRFNGPSPTDTTTQSTSNIHFSTLLEAQWRSPDGRLRLLRCYPDGGGPPDVCVENISDGTRVTIASSPGDDNPVAWSPDGKRILIASDRGVHGSYNYDLFAVDVDNRDVLRISDDPYQTDHAMWSPDGTRIAYRWNRTGSGALIIAEASGQTIRTIEIPGEVGDPVWSPDAARIAFCVTEGDGSRRIYLLDPAFSANARAVRFTEGLWTPVWSPDGRYIAGGVASTTGPVKETRFVLVGDSTDQLVGSVSGLVAAWLPAQPPAYVDRLVAPEMLRIMSAERVRVPVTAIGRDGRPFSLFQLELTADDPSILATIGGDTVAALTPGHTMLEISAGGWRSARIPVNVLPADPPQLVFDEDWSAGIDTTRWKHFGSPAATILDTPHGPAMRSNGDAAFVSGVVTTHRFSLTGGLAIEWTQSTPLNG